MAAIEKTIKSLLSGASSVSSMVSSRIYPICAPQNSEFPFITYQRVSAPRRRSLDGPTGRAQPRIQIDAYALTYAGVKTLAEAVRKTLDGFRGTIEDVRIWDVALESDQDLIEDEFEPKLFRVCMDFIVTHDE